MIIHPPTQVSVTEKYWGISIESENYIFQVKVPEMKVVSLPQEITIWSYNEMKVLNDNFNHPLLKRMEWKTNSKFSYCPAGEISIKYKEK